MNEHYEKGSIAKKIFAWSGLLIIAILIIVIIYALTTGNGKMAFAAIVCLILISCVYWLGILVYKRLITMKELRDKNIEEKSISELANYNTKNI